MSAAAAIPRPVLGVLLAGGLSRRMGGGDKCLLSLGDQTMLDAVLTRLRPQVDHLIINANGDPERFSAFRLPVVADPIEGFVGPLAGVLAGMRYAASHHPDVRHVVSAATDTPFLPGDLVARLIAGADAAGTPIALAASDGQEHPVFGLWPVALADDLERALAGGLRKVLHWTDAHGWVAVPFEPIMVAGQPVDPFFNANHPEDLAKARRMAEGGQP